MKRVISVVGRGTATVVPDTAVLRVAVVYRAPSVRDAYDGVAAATEGVLAAAREAVDEHRISTLDLQVWTDTDHRGRPSGFECRHTVEVRCPSTSVAASLLGVLVERGGDRLQVEGVTPEVTDDTAARAAAREAAYADAEARARQLAGLAGVGLGAPLSIIELPAGGPRPLGPESRMAAAAEAVEVVAGERSVTAAVEVRFALGEPAPGA